jgi:hypothetical protein
MIDQERRAGSDKTLRGIGRMLRGCNLWHTMTFSAKPLALPSLPPGARARQRPDRSYFKAISVSVATAAGMG